MARKYPGVVVHRYLRLVVNDRPPKWSGCQHFSFAPLYGYNGYLYLTPGLERDYMKSTVEEYDGHLPPEHPEGSYEYYNNRDMALMIPRFDILY